MGFLLLLAVWSAVSYYVGFRAEPHTWQYRSRVAFVVSLALIALVGYFEWREYRSVGELAALVEPIPDVTDVMYVPTAAELGAIGAVVAALPAGSKSARTGADPQSAARAMGSGRFWRLTTTMRPGEVIDFHAAPAQLRDWTIEHRSANALVLARGPETMTIYVQDDWGARHVWYIYR